METMWLYEDLSYELENESLTKEDKIKSVMDLWECDKDKAIDFIKYNNITFGRCF